VKPAEGKETFPSEFSRYTLVERLATGGMAEVFKAKILSTHGFEKLLVIKRILPHLAADKTFVSMFIDEAKLTAQLVHPKIVQVTDFGEVSGQYFIALEYVDGLDALALLRTSAQRQVRLPVPICIFVTMEVLDALDYAHNARDAEGKPMRIVHRDISPSNVFISRRGDVKLGDFGIAHAQERESKTQAGTLKGKYGYMSPEQVVGGSLDGRSDVFAVGIVLAEMLMGRRLFTAPNDLDVLLMVRDGRLDRLDKYCKDVPADLDFIVRKALKKRAADRYQTAGEFRDALGDHLFQMGFRIGPSDLGRMSMDYFDPSPEALERLKEQARKWKVSPRTTGVHPVVGDTTPQPRPALTPTSGVSGNWALAPSPSSPSPSPSPSKRPPSPAAVSSSSMPAHDPPTDMSAPPDLDVEMDEPVAEAAPPPEPRPATRVDAAAMAALDHALSGALSIVDLDQYTSGSDAGPSPIESIPAAAEPTPPPGSPVPDNVGDLTVLSPMRVFADLALAGETGLLRIEFGQTIKDVYLVRGAPESVSSNQQSERFGEYLLARGFVRQNDLDRALQHVAQTGSKLGDALVTLGIMRQLDVFRLLSQQVRERVMELFTWAQGLFAFYRGIRNPTDAFPLGLDSFEILGAGVLTLSYEFLEARFGVLSDFKPRSVSPPRIGPEAFRLGNVPREVWTALDGRRTMKEWTSRFTSSGDLLTFLRVVYLLLETDLARLE